MKKKLVLTAAVIAALSVASCNSKKAGQNGNDENASYTEDSALVEKDGSVKLPAVEGTYEGTLPAADCPGIKTVLTLKADSTYQFTSDYIDRKDGHDEASGVLEVLDGNVLMLVRPSSGEHTFYKVKDAESIAMTDSLGNEAEGEIAKLYVLTKKK